jgi:mevalonate kinase
MKSFVSNTKLMISGEYLVLQGASSLALPLKHTQELSVLEQPGDPSIEWKSFINNDLWFELNVSLPNFEILTTTDSKMAQTLVRLLKTAEQLNPKFLEDQLNYMVTSVMDFKPDWGIGSSSSLVSNLALWAECDPFLLNKLVFGGSGYDIACARASTPIMYHLDNSVPTYREAQFYPKFHTNLYFIYLNRKQSSKDSIQKSDLSSVTTSTIERITAISNAMELADSLQTFQDLLEEHENIISETLQVKKVKDLYFKDFHGSIKSLGAWGGDFILVASSKPESEIKEYFEKKGFNTFFRFAELVLPKDNLKKNSPV